MDKNVNHAPHVVILGAGASIAAYQHWGSFGPPLPSMQDLIDVLSLRTLLERSGFKVEGLNFESFYDDLASSGQAPDLKNEVETRLAEYFRALALPDQVTIYDYLILSLRGKDLIASFNWDPFLMQAYLRNERIGATRRPRIAFLHGNVCVGVCHKDKVVGINGNRCSRCGEPLGTSKLLYPVKHKDYASDPLIESEWHTLRHYLRNTYYLTIFGYSAPKTDVEARALMLEVWNENRFLEFAEVDVIDVKPTIEIESIWEEFFFSHHYGVAADVFDSYIFRHPRRTCDAFASASLMCDPWYENPFPKFERLADLQSWIAPLVAEEVEYDIEKAAFSGQPLDPNKPKKSTR